MTDLTTARLQRLLDGSSPGPWTAKNDDDWNETIVANECGHALTWGDQVRFKMEAGDTNTDPHLAALAPQLAEEVIRLRKELRKIRIDLHETTLCDGGTTGPYLQGATAQAAATIKQIDQILGDHDE